jgi:hypothetical protein
MTGESRVRNHTKSTNHLPNTITMPEGWAVLRMFVPMPQSKQFSRFNKLIYKLIDFYWPLVILKSGWRLSSNAGHSDGHGEVLKRYMQHLPIQHVQGYTRSQWMPLRRPPERQQTKRRCNMCPLCWPFWWPLRCAGTILHASPDGGGSWLS